MCTRCTWISNMRIILNWFPAEEYVNNSQRQLMQMKCNLCSRKIFGWHTQTHTHSTNARLHSAHNMCLAAGECVCLWSEFQFIYSIQIHECRAQDIHIQFAEAFFVVVVPSLLYTPLFVWIHWIHRVQFTAIRYMGKSWSCHVTCHTKRVSALWFCVYFHGEMQTNPIERRRIECLHPICRFRSSHEKLYAHTHIVLCWGHLTA